MPPSDLLIDDLEDGDRYIRQVDGRHGEWSIANDGTSGQQYPTGTFFPASPGANTSHYAARTWGQGFTSWGAGLRVTLEANGQSSCRYDASSTTGLGLYTKGTGTVTLSVATAGTVPPELGGTCNGACYDYHAMKLTLSSNWTHYEMAWSQLSQQGWGTAVQFDPTAILYIEFEFGTNVAFDIYVDDLKFLK